MPDPLSHVRAILAAAETGTDRARLGRQGLPAQFDSAAGDRAIMRGEYVFQGSHYFGRRTASSGVNLKLG